MSSLGAPRLVAELLCQRGYDTEEKVISYFNPRITDLHDPFLMKDMDKAVERINLAIDRNEGVLVFGDYDVDGTTSVALMYKFLKPLIAHLERYVPDREKEGYGISKQGIDFAHENGLALIIALDCGIRSVELVNYANSLGIDFIICDHHLPGDSLPEAIAVLDPKRADCEYPYKELSGCGIGFKLIEAIAQVRDMQPNSYLQLLDLVAVSIAADIVPITGENRVLAHFGLKVVNEQPSLGIHCLKQVSVEKEVLGIGDLVFYLGPRINVAGRLGHAMKAVDLLVSEDIQKATEISKLLNDWNGERRNYDSQVVEDVKKRVAEDPELLNRSSLVFYDATWHKGVIGIAASKVVELYHKPTVILCGEGEELTGSARSIANFNIHDALSACSDFLLKFGGHKYAAGLRLEREQFMAFDAAFEAFARANLNAEDLEPKLLYDLEIELKDVDWSLLTVLQRMEPFGPGNKTPVFRSVGLTENGNSRVIGKTAEHLKLGLKGTAGKVDAIGFGLASKYEDIKKADSFEACFQVQENIFRGETSIQLVLKDLKPTYYTDSISSRQV